MKALLAGLVTGIGLGVLFAPRRGEQSRRQLRSKAESLGELALGQAGSFGQEAVQQARESAAQIKDAVADLATKSGLGPLTVLNTASREELMKIRGIGPVLADRIIRGRPFTSMQQLSERGVLPANVLQELERESKSA